MVPASTRPTRPPMRRPDRQEADIPVGGHLLEPFGSRPRVDDLRADTGQPLACLRGDRRGLLLELLEDGSADRVAHRSGCDHVDRDQLGAQRTGQAPGKRDRLVAALGAVVGDNVMEAHAFPSVGDVGPQASHEGGRMVNTRELTGLRRCIAVLRVHRIPFSTNVERVALAAAHKDLAVEWVDHTAEDRSAVRALSGQDLVPVAELDEEIVVGSMVIVERLEVLAPAPPLYPSDPAARAMTDVFISWFNGVWKAPPNALADELDGPDPDPSRVVELGGLISRGCRSSRTCSPAGTSCSEIACRRPTSARSRS